jgi:hypothetical protein
LFLSFFLAFLFSIVFPPAVCLCLLVETNMPGFLVPDHYQVVSPGLNDLLVASIIWGFTLATGMFSGHKAVKQTYAQWKRSGRAKPYVIMVWAEWLVSIIISVLSWCFLRGFIEPR